MRKINREPRGNWGRKSAHTETGARFSKVPKLFGCSSSDIILFVSSKQRRLEARNFAVIWIFIPFTTYEKTSFTEWTSRSFMNGFLGPKSLRDFRETGPWTEKAEHKQKLPAVQLDSSRLNWGQITAAVITASLKYITMPQLSKTFSSASECLSQFVVFNVRILFNCF